nr:helix-turn-helix transcriptional regulator [Schleiferilactobacillus shenzhenensis]
MMTYGETFRYFRVNKGLTLKQVADEVNSVSLIGQFETNRSHISVERFVHLLDKIAVSYDEFQLKRQGTTRSPAAQRVHDFDYLTSIETVIDAQGKHISMPAWRAHLAALAAENDREYNLRIDQTVQLNRYYDTPTDQRPADALAGLQYYLTQVDDWGQYEFSLYKHCIRGFPVDVAWRMLRNVGKKAALMHSLPGYDEEICLVYFTAITGFIVHGDLTKAWAAWRLARDFCYTHSATHSVMELPAMAGWITLHEGKEDQAKALFAETLSYYTQFHLTKLHDQWQEILTGQIEAYHRHLPQFFVFVTPFE